MLYISINFAVALRSLYASISQQFSNWKRNSLQLVSSDMSPQSSSPSQTYDAGKQRPVLGHLNWSSSHATVITKTWSLVRNTDIMYSKMQLRVHDHAVVCQKGRNVSYT